MQTTPNIRYGHVHGTVARPTGQKPAFTLIELLAVVAILSILMTIMVVSLVRVRTSAKSFVCMNNLKTVSFEFLQFADDYSRASQQGGQGPKGFYIENFQEKLYGVNGYWKLPPFTERTEPINPKTQPLMCPAGPQELKRTSGKACQQALHPVSNISIAFNRSLYMVRVTFGNRPIWRSVRLNKHVLKRTTIPLAFDVDGVRAAERGALPHYQTPPPAGVNPGVWPFWFTSNRHAGRTNAAFVGGHVLSSPKPELEAGWDWKYHPPLQ